MRNALLVSFIVVLGIVDAFIKWGAINTPFQNDGALIDLTLHKNPGIAFDIPLPLSLILVLSAIIIVVIAYNLFRDRGAGNIIGSTLVITGALNNAIDRAIHGYTTDYILLFQLSVINISDILILSGVLALLCYHEFTSRAVHNN